MGNIEAWVKVIQVLVGTVVIGVSTLLVNSEIQKREIAIKEMEQLGKYVDIVTQEEVGRRLKFSEFFMSMTQSEEARKGWERYHALVQKEYDALEEQKKTLAQEKIKRDRELKSLAQKALANAKTITELQRKLAQSPANQKQYIKSELNKKRAEAVETAASLADKEKSLASTQQKLTAAIVKLSFIPIQKVIQSFNEGWVLLGSYDGESWTSSFFDMNNTVKPKKLVGKEITVAVSAVNIRKAKPDVSGKLGEVEDAISNGMSVTVQRVEKWSDSEYFWAQVSYTPSHNR